MVGRMALGPVHRVTADSCPGVLRPHLAADGALVRVRVPGGALPVVALRGLRTVAAELADGSLGLTSRANVQIRGVSPKRVAVAESLLAGLGLLPHPTHERVRNIIASPLSGRSAWSLVDVDPLVVALDEAICARPALAALPGRFMIGLDDGTGDVLGEEPDVLVAAMGPNRFEVRPAGAEAGAEVPTADVVDAVLRVSAVFLAERSRQNSRAWRVGELPGAATAMLAALIRRGYRTVPGRLPGVGPLPAPGLIEQRDGRFAVCAVVPLGILDGEQLDALVASCELAEDTDLADAAVLDGASTGPGAKAGVAGLRHMVSTPLRVTPWRRVVIRDLELSAALAAQELLSTVGLVLEPRAAWTRVTACAGLPGCARSLTDVRTDARTFAAACAPVGPPVHWAGCERGCGMPHGAVALLATSGGYRAVGELGEADRAVAAGASIGTIGTEEREART